MQDRILSMLGLAAKAGKICSGEFSVTKAVKENKALLVIVSEDASDNTKKNFSDMCSYRNIPIRFYGTKERLGKCIGKELRSNLAVLDQGFADKLAAEIQEVEI